MTDPHTPTSASSGGGRGDDVADFVVISPAYPARFERLATGQSLYAAIEDYIPDQLGTQGIGRYRLYFYDDMSGPELQPNRRADAAVAQLGYQHPTGWYGTVIVTMEENGDGVVPGLSPEVRDIVGST